MRKKLLSIQEREIYLVSPEVKNDSVTFRLRAPYATTVSMYGMTASFLVSIEE